MPQFSEWFLKAADIEAEASISLPGTQPRSRGDEPDILHFALVGLLRHRRQNLVIDLADLSRRVDVPVADLEAFERGDRPQTILDHLTVLCQELALPEDAVRELAARTGGPVMARAAKEFFLAGLDAGGPSEDSYQWFVQTLTKLHRDRLHGVGLGRKLPSFSQSIKECASVK
jgi:hypothetical protein